MGALSQIGGRKMGNHAMSCPSRKGILKGMRTTHKKGSIRSSAREEWGITHLTIRTLLAWVFWTFLWAIALSGSAQAASAVEIDAKVNASLKRFYKEVDAGKELANKSKGVLVFPSVIKAGFGIGGEYGEGALRINGRTVNYYNTAAASIGLQLGAQAKTVILLFMEREALSGFQNSDGWEVGVDGSVALVTIGAGTAIDTTNIKDPIIGFVFNNKGLMYNLTLEGSKITKLKK
jgi:lipid-binding SYLF domain-containing protein